MIRRRRALLGAAASAGVLLLAFAALLPPRAIRFTGASERPDVVRGSLHVHSVRSDGSDTPDAIASAARDAGLQFVVFTDHGDGTRPPDPPAYRHGVLCLDAVEISTTAGHYIALGLRGPAPYRLGGDPADVVDDVRRLGGFGIAAHPASPKAALAWEGWDLPFDAFEWLNADSEWRDESRWTLARALATYYARGPETIAGLFERPAALLARWDERATRRRIVALAGHDAHGTAGWPDGAAEGRDRWRPLAPSYGAAFASFAVRVRLAGAFTGDAARDAAALVAAIRAGHAYTAIDAFASPAPFTFEAHAAAASGQMGDGLPAGADVELTARAVDRPGLSLWLIRNGHVVASGAGKSLVYRHRATAEPAVYRVEAWLERHGSMPWIVSNPIYIGVPAEPPAADAEPSGGGSGRPIPGRWRVEREPHCAIVIDHGDVAGPGGIHVDAHLARGPRSPYAAAVLGFDAGTLASARAVRFSGRSARPMRVSVQVRVPTTGARWIRSVYLESSPRTIAVPLSTMTPVDGAGAPPRAALDSLLFVVDTVHTVPGSGAEFWIEDVEMTQ